MYYSEEALKRKFAKEGKGKFRHDVMSNCSGTTKAIYTSMKVLNFAGNVNEAKLSSL